MKSPLLLSVLICLAITACHQPDRPTINFIEEGNDIPIVFRTSLADSLPDSALKSMQLEPVTGIKIQFLSGKYISYFAYETDMETAVSTISQLPFPMGNSVSDTLCRRISRVDLDTIRETLSQEELEHSTFFWHPESNIEIYDCIKSPFRHTLLLNNNTRQVWHRIERMTES